ncbi:MAG: DUF460 domain-containing protein [Methanocorpusculum sp.]|uniref:DUF460 domain-containing protein n=1 Tax=Methanocorpusculum sp. TaxID=2058474 RepID=UPI002718DB40|nr:DUF460 domain-containing protein [Methanocorpusculum sp.]MDO9523481.1 DUF460 domain-containing protein [Methanocorpusculum sp.]
MNPLVFGIDKTKGSSARSPDGLYALVRVVDRRIESEERNLTLQRLLHLINAEKPGIIAVGSLRDIVPETGSLFTLTEALPFGTKLVLIACIGAKIAPLPKLAERYNLRFDAENPMEQAKISALIASFGGGYEVQTFDGVTTITVSRARPQIRTHKGRYIRHMQGSVMSFSREIEAGLLANGLMFSSSMSRSSRGERIVKFTVSAPRHDVPASSRTSAGVLVRVTGTKKEHPSFVPLSKRPAYLIVGIVPGTTVGIAALNLDGDLIHLSSSHALGQAEIIASISKIGRPVLVATDKAAMPFGVEKVRRAFSAIAWTPARDVQVKETYELTEGYDFANDHERDALSAAVLAYQSYANKFEAVQKRMPPGTDIDMVRAGIVRGLSQDQILEALKNPEEMPEEPVIIEEELVPDEKDERIAKLEEEVANLRIATGSLSEEVEVKDKAIASLQKQLVFERRAHEAEILSSRKIPPRDMEPVPKKDPRTEVRGSKDLQGLQALQIRLERLKNFISLQAGEGSTALKVLPLLADDSVKALDDEMGVGEEDILYVLTIDGWDRPVIRDLAEAKIGAVILPRLTYQRAHSQHLIEEFREANVPVLDGANLSPRVKGKIGVVDTAAFESALADWKTTQAVYNNEKKSGVIPRAAKEQVERPKPAPVQAPVPAAKPEPPAKEKTVFRAKPVAPIPVPKPAPTQAPVSKPVPKPVLALAPKPIPKPIPKPVPKPLPAAKPAPKKEAPKKSAPSQKAESGSAEKILFGVLSEYREERKKEMKK